MMLEGSEINIQLFLGYYVYFLGCFYELVLYFMQVFKVNCVLVFFKILFGIFFEYIVWSFVSVEQCLDCII